MEEKKPGKLEQFLAGKGFYIVLALCIVVIGISVWSITNHSVAKNVNIDEGVTLENPNDGDTAPVISETTPSPVIDETEPEPEGKKDVFTQDDVYTAPTTWVWPVSGDIDREYSVDALKYDVTMDDWRTHEGLDIAAKQGDEVHAAADGTVASVENDELYGTTVTIDHGAGMKTVYSNLEDTPTVAAGDSVKAGDTIGAVGTSAICEANQQPHVHVVVLKDGNSVNPQEYLPG